jgi:hypothetical protein
MASNNQEWKEERGMRRRGIFGIVTFLALGLFFVPAAAFATSDGLGGILTSQGNDISVQILANNAGFTEGLYVFQNGPTNPGTFISLASNTGANFCVYSTGATCGANSLAPGSAPLVPGNVPANGTEVVFGVNIPGNQLGRTYNTYNVFTGNTTRNPDNLTHNNNAQDGPQPGGGNLENVGFEDLLGQVVGGVCQPAGFPIDGNPCSDRDFNDTVYLFGGLNPPPPPPHPGPEPSSLLLLGSGLAGLTGVAWRRRRK